MPVVAQFASRRAELIVVERAAIPIWEGPHQVATKAGKQHHFKDGLCRVEGQQSVDFMRAQIAHGLEAWELDGASDVPSSIELLSELATAELSRVREILAAERETANRSEVTGTCERILERAGAAERGPGAQKAKARHEVVTA